jgi:hypothetical protein
MIGIYHRRRAGAYVQYDLGMEKVGVWRLGAATQGKGPYVISPRGTCGRSRRDQDEEECEQVDPAQSQGGGGGGEACVLMRKRDGALSCHVGVCACSHVR